MLPIQEPLQTITAAVTPAVMISATAILLSAVNSRHQSLSDRLRALSAEMRERPTPKRAASVRRQILLFERRLRFVTAAHASLFGATACFISMVIVIAFTSRATTLVAAMLPPFMVGVLLLLTAVMIEMLELRLASQSITLEVESALENE